MVLSQGDSGISMSAALDKGFEDECVFFATSANIHQRPKTAAMISAGSGSGFGSVTPVFGDGGTPAGGKPWGERDGGGAKRRPTWQIAAILLARSRRSGYAK